MRLCLHLQFEVQQTTGFKGRAWFVNRCQLCQSLTWCCSAERLPPVSPPTAAPWPRSPPQLHNFEIDLRGFMNGCSYCEFAFVIMIYMSTVFFFVCVCFFRFLFVFSIPSHSQIKKRPSAPKSTKESVTLHKIHKPVTHITTHDITVGGE